MTAEQQAIIELAEVVKDLIRMSRSYQPTGPWTPANSRLAKAYSKASMAKNRVESAINCKV